MKEFIRWCEIDLQKINHNVFEIKKHIGKAGLMAVLKSNAYGHGLLEVGKYLDGNNNVASFGVYTVAEGLALREGGINKDILVMGPIFYDEEFDLISRNNLQVMLMGFDMLGKMADKREKKFNVHIKIDTGLRRFGFLPDDMMKVVEIIKSSPNITVVGVASHLASLEDGMEEYTNKQIELFDRAARILESHGFDFIRHIGAASAVLAYPRAHFDLIRVGISVYGLWPSLDIQRKYHSLLNLLPAMSFKTKIVYRKKIEKGDAVGYGGTFVADRDMTIGIIPVGYYEGLDRRMSNNGAVVVCGKKAPIIGRVAMNTTIIDLSGVDEAVEGDEVVLIGESGGVAVLAEEVADRCSMVPHEITTKIPDFVSRVYLR